MAKIASLLQIPTRSTTTHPTSTEVEEVINRAEDRIDSVTGHAWRTRYSGTTTGQDTTQHEVLIDVAFNYKYQSGIPVYLPNRKIKTLSASDGDELKYWTGSEYETWLGVKTEGRGNDFWVDYERGIVFLRTYLYTRKPMGLKIKYRYGETYVPYDIENICTKMAAIDILAGMDARAMIVQENSPTMTHNQRIDLWSKEVEKELQRYKEFVSPIRNY